VDDYLNGTTPMLAVECRSGVEAVWKIEMSVLQRSWTHIEF
jgi:hypothetical protein